MSIRFVSDILPSPPSLPPFPLKAPSFAPHTRLNPPLRAMALNTLTSNYPMCIDILGPSITVTTPHSELFSASCCSLSFFLLLLHVTYYFIMSGNEQGLRSIFLAVSLVIARYGYLGLWC